MGKYFKTAYQFGMLGGILSGLSFFLLSLLNPDPTNLNLIFGYVITPISIYLAITYFKLYLNGGFLSFAEGMTVGAVTYFLLATLSTIGIWVVLSNSPELFSAIYQSKTQVLIQNKDTIISQVGLESFQIAEAELKNMSPWDLALNDGLWKIIPGMFFSILISIILRKNKLET